MKDISEVIDALTINNQYATDVCLLLYLNEDYTSLHYLDYLDIKGKELETLADKCIPEMSLEYLSQTIRFLRSGFLSNDEIKANLNSNNPVTFIDRVLKKGEDWDFVYENYASRFRNLQNKNKKR